MINILAVCIVGILSMGSILAVVLVLVRVIQNRIAKQLTDTIG